MNDTLDIDHLSGWIGRTEEHDDHLDAGLAARFRATFDLADPQDGTAPLLIHFCLAQPVAPTADLAEDGHPHKGGFLPPVPLPRRMWAGGDITFHTALRVGAPIKRRSQIADVQIKSGRSGTLCFVTVEHQIDADGKLAITERQGIVYREAQSGSPTLRVQEDQPAQQTRHVTPSEPLLFRYSALTFNAHRIHYDERYTTGTEGYSGLVVHGPMQATLLCQFAADLAGTAPRRFAFRSTAPILGTAPFALCADLQDAQATLWTARAGAGPVMTAEAYW